MCNYVKKTGLWIATAFAIFALMFQPIDGEANMKDPPPEKMPVIIVGDRVVDIAYNLRVLPAAMSVRGGLWPMSSTLKTVSQILGCPQCIVSANPKIVPETAKKLGISRIIIEKHPQFCLYRPKMNPVNVVPLLEGTDLKIEYVDFAEGLDSAIRQTAKLLGRESKAEALIERYHTELAAAKNNLPKTRSGKKVIIFSGIYQASTGKSFLRLEAPGGYSDRFLLEPLGCINVGDRFNPGNAKVGEGYYPVQKKKGMMALDPLITANPDVIVAVGDALALQMSIVDNLKVNPKLAQVTALKNGAVYSLPSYCDSSVIEYPAILSKWTAALSEQGRL